MGYAMDKIHVWISISLVSLLVMVGCSLNQGSSTGSDASEESIAQIPSPTPVITESPTRTPQPTLAEDPEPIIEESDDGIIASNDVAVADAAPVACTLRTSWPTYTVVSGDTLSRIASRTNSSVSELAAANCMNDPSLLTVGQQLYVPRQPQRAEASSDQIVSDNARSTNDDCRIVLTQRTPVVNAPQGTGRVTLGYLDPNTTVIPVIHFDGLPYYGIDYDGVIGWVDAQPQGDCSNLPNSVPEANACRFTLPEQTTVMDSPESTDRNSLGYLAAGTVVTPVAYKVLSYYGVHYGIPFNNRYGWISAPDQPACTGLPDTLPGEPRNDPAPNPGYACSYTPQQPIEIRTFPTYDDPVDQTLTVGVTYEVKSDGLEGWYYVEAADPFVSGWAQFTPSGDCANLPVNPYFCTFVATTEATVYAQSNEGARVMGTLPQGEERRFSDFGPAYTGSRNASYWIRVVYTPQRAVSGFIRNTEGVLQGRCPVR